MAPTLRISVARCHPRRATARVSEFQQVRHVGGEGSDVRSNSKAHGRMPAERPVLAHAFPRPKRQARYESPSVSVIRDSETLNCLAEATGPARLRGIRVRARWRSERTRIPNA